MMIKSEYIRQRYKRQVFILNRRNKNIFLWKICLFSIEKYLEIKDKQNLRSFERKRSETSGRKPSSSNGIDFLSVSLSRADDHPPTNDDQHAKGKIEQRNIRVHLNFDALWLFLLARRRRREETILHHYGSFFLIAFAVTKNLSSSSFEINFQNARCETKLISTWTLVALRPAMDAICWVAANMMFM